MTVNEQFRDLLQRYCAGLPDRIELLDRLLALGCGVEGQASALTKAQNITHEMKGTGGSLGFPDISAAASVLDDNLKVLAKQSGVEKTEHLVAKELFARLKAIVAQATPRRSTLYNIGLSDRGVLQDMGGDDRDGRSGGAA